MPKCSPVPERNGTPVPFPVYTGTDHAGERTRPQPGASGSATAVAAALTRLGLDPDDRTARDTATAVACPGCRALVLVGLDDTVAALRVVVDPWPLTVSSEAAAWLSVPPRPTYRLTTHARRATIRARDHWAIAGTSPGPDCHVVAAHRCDAPTPAAWLAAQTTHRPGPQPTETGPPPF